MSGKRQRSPKYPKPKPNQNKNSLPKRKIKPKTKKKSIDIEQISVPLANRFDALDTADTATNTNTTVNASSSKKQKIAPITVTDMRINVQEIIDDLNIDCDLKLVSVGEKIFPRSIEDKEKIIKELNGKKVDFFSHPDIENKIFKVILSGLPQIEITEIENDLKTVYNIEPTKIVMFTSHSHNKLYLCHFDRNKVNMKTLNTIKVVYHHMVKWQPYKPRADTPTQCYKCSMYGHGARSCNRFAVCFLCSENHLTKDCTQITPNMENPVYKCYNCSSTPGLPHSHKANDVNCPFRAKYMAAKTKAKENNKRKSPNSGTSNRNENNSGQRHQYVLAPQPPPLQRSFADTMKHSNAQRNTQFRTAPSSQSSNQHTFAPSHTDNGLWSFAEVAQILRQSINELKQCQTKFDQLTVIANLLENACK